jgi:hypothetical protein
MSATGNDESDKLQQATSCSSLTHLAFEILRSKNQSLFSRTPEGDSATMQSFREAILFAEQLQKAVSDRGEELIHAYRLFPCDRRIGSDPLSVEEIYSRFAETGWEKGMAEGTVRNRVEEILEQVAKEAERRREGLVLFLESNGFASLSEDYIEVHVGNLLDDLSISQVISDVDQLRVRISGVVRRMIDHAMKPILGESGISESPTDPLTIASFMRFLCGHDSIEAALQARTKGMLRVRPYELFLFAYQQDFKTAKLTKPRKELNEGFIPEIEYSSQLSIMVSHGGADAALEEWMRKSSSRNQS